MPLLLMLLLMLLLVEVDRVGAIALIWFLLRQTPTPAVSSSNELQYR